ncbi:hypothetical protein J8I87_40120 [Paraburkholderia sp. LEh10]|uniref:hypothetical protein n=1 Tax=Paraburkholderia sp. LEh10 TaxID=2821353 RepID=UPI001AE298B4|nr:hypothetical protein [Paraburkholderia sp. LEh10]MBP0595740.1 hypothetical protein [Paraburkholderia sp. LEh10]
MNGTSAKESANNYRQSHAEKLALTYIAHEWLKRHNPSTFELRATGAKAGWAP